MPFPPSVQTVTLTLGPLYDPAGQPVRRAVLSATLPGVVRILEDGAVLATTSYTRTDETGVASLTLVATDSTGVDRTGFTYKIRADGVTPPGGIDTALPAAIPAVDVEDLLPVAADSGTVWLPAGDNWIGLVPDPENPGFYLVGVGGALTEDPVNDGFYLIGA